MKPRINVITVAVDDLEKSLAFYRDSLGWRPRWPAEGTVAPFDHAAFELQSGLSFVLYPRDSLARDAKENGAQPSSAEFILTHIVSNRAEVDALLKRAEAGGAAVIGPPIEEPWGYSGKFKDLDGHVWEILWDPKFKEYVRHDFGAVRPYLYGHLDLSEFVERTFGAVELERQKMGDGYHIETKIGDSVVTLETGEFPPDVTPTRASIYVYVEDVDAAYQRAIECGATSLTEPEDKPYDERVAGVQDTFGNTWWISTFKKRV
jgi:PhnB protein